MLALLALSALAAPLVLAQRGATVDRYDYSNNYVYASASDYDDCEYTSYYVNGNVYDDDTRVVSIEVSYDTYCGDYGDYAYYYACVNLNVPDEATWVRDGNRVTITASGTLVDCGYYSYGGNEGNNPYVGAEVSVTLELFCKTLDRSSSNCQYRSNYAGFSSKDRYRSKSNSCYVDGNVGTFVINGMSKTLEYGSFGEYTDKSMTVTKPRRLA